MRNPALGVLTILPLVVLSAACLDVAEHRAEVDETVGQAVAGDTSVVVAGGLAAVRALAPGALHLWGSAPNFHATLEPGAAGTSTWQVRIENLLSDATLTAHSADGGLLPVTLVGTPFATEKIWQITPTGGPVTLAIGTPDAGDAGWYRFAAFADVQEAVGRVQDIFSRMNADPAIRFAVMAGDLTDQGRARELERYQLEMKSLRFPVFTTLGNHELGMTQDMYHRYFGRGSYQFTFRNVSFTLLDSASATLAPIVYDWLDDWLADAAGGFHAVFMHIPPLDPSGARNGGFASRAEANHLVGRLARGGVNLTIYGHVHSFYAYSNAGVPAFISGGGGAIPERFDRLGRHFLTIDVDPVTQNFQTALVRID